jgi:hypothetical protein
MPCSVALDRPSPTEAGAILRAPLGDFACGTLTDDFACSPPDTPPETTEGFAKVKHLDPRR